MLRFWWFYCCVIPIYIDFHYSLISSTKILNNLKLFLGYEHATGAVLTYLDSHCECTEGWLEPLLDRIARNSTTVVCPVIDVIDDTTLAYIYHDSSSVNVGGFDWNLQFNWHAVPQHEKKRHNNTAEPVWSPTMAGGLFSIDRVRMFLSKNKRKMIFLIVFYRFMYEQTHSFRNYS